MPMNNLLSLHAVTLCQVYTTLCFGAWIQDQSVGLGGCPFKCEGIVLSQTSPFFAAHITVPGSRVAVLPLLMFEVRHVCGFVSSSDKEMGYQEGGRLTQNMVTGLIRVVYILDQPHTRGLVQRVGQMNTLYRPMDPKRVSYREQSHSAV